MPSPCRQVMVVTQPSKREWVDFQHGANNFSSESEKSTTATSKIRKPHRDHSSWMQEPIRADGKWVPMDLPVPVPFNHGLTGSTRSSSPSARQQANLHDTFRSPGRSLQSQDGSSYHRRKTADSSSPRPPKPKRSHSSSIGNPVISPDPRPAVLLPSRERSSTRESSVRPPKTRGRSNSRTRNNHEKRERSTSKARSTRGASQSSTHRTRSESNGTKNPGRFRPPVTARKVEVSSRGRSRSNPRDGRPRTARSRSASLTRVTNTHTAQLSPVVRSCSNGPSKSRPPAAPNGRPKASSSQGRTSRSGSEDPDQDVNLGSDISLGNLRSNTSVSSSDSRRKKALGSMFGEQEGMRNDFGGMGQQIRPRVLLAATVYHNTATSLWITTINTNQKGVARDPKLANKYLKAFSFPSEQEARESAIANAPPKMIPFSEFDECSLCKSPFTVFKRASHCRNCGVCVCKDCLVHWPAKMIPDTYNLKNEAVVKVCRSCNSISRAFRRALQQGNYESALALYGTGNVNLRTPFPVSSKRDEIMWPVHYAVEGGNIDILRWLVDIRFCPIGTIPSGMKKPRRGTRESLIMTSAGRNVLSIAIESLKVDIMHYLVVDRGVSIYESTELEPSLRALEATLIALPRPCATQQIDDQKEAEPRWDNGSYDDMSVPSSIGIDSSSKGRQDDSLTTGSKTKNSDCCIVCYERKIDCVATPCGHQVICLECSSNLSSCPVCNHKGDFIKIFRP